MTIQGLRNHGLGGTVTGISNYLDQNGTIGGYARLVKRWPSRYSGALVRTAAALAGFGDGSQTDDILQPNYDDPAPRLFPAPVALADQPLPVEAARRASWATTILRWLYPIDQLLMGPATVLLVLTWVAATARKHWALAGALSIPLALLGSYWLFLWSLDRYGHPVHQARIAATVICVGYVLKAAHDRYDAWNERHGAQPDRTEVET